MIPSLGAVPTKLVEYRNRAAMKKPGLVFLLYASDAIQSGNQENVTRGVMKTR